MSQIISISLGMVKVFLIKGEQPILIDAGNPGSGKKILKKIEEHGIAPEEIKLIIMTHAHSDHFGGLHFLTETLDAKVAIHQQEAENLTNGDDTEVKPVGIKGHLAKMLIPNIPNLKGVSPDIVIQEEMSLEAFGVNGKVIHTPGHTPGSVSVILDSGEAIVGDLIMGGFIRSDTPDFAIFAFDTDQIKESVKKVLSYEPKTVYVSHGGPFSAKEVAEKFEIKI